MGEPPLTEDDGSGEDPGRASWPRRLAVLGAAVFLIWALFEWLQTRLAGGALPGAARVALVVAGLGLAVLLITAARERLFAERDPPGNDATGGRRADDAAGRDHAAGHHHAVQQRGGAAHDA